MKHVNLSTHTQTGATTHAASHVKLSISQSTSTPKNQILNQPELYRILLPFLVPNGTRDTAFDDVPRYGLGGQGLQSWQ